MRDTTARATLADVARFAAALGVLAVLAYLAYRIVSVAFQLGIRFGIRSVLSLIVPMFVGAWLSVRHREAVLSLRRLPAYVRFSASLAAGTLAMASLPWFARFYPLPISELIVASCIAILAYTSTSVPGSARPLAPYGLAAGMLLYLFAFGAPRMIG